MRTQSLPFELRAATSTDDLVRARRVRALSYGRHIPGMATALLSPDPADADAGTRVVVCIDKATRDVVGTARFHTSASGPLRIERGLDLPPALHADRRAEVSRLSTDSGADPLVKLALMKASFRFCRERQVRWLLAGARSRALLRQYTALGFEPLYDDGRMVRLAHAGDLDHHILVFDIARAESQWQAAAHPLYRFMFETCHPDIRPIA